MHKIIGICPRIVTVDNREKIFTNNSYIRYLESHGFRVLILPLNPDIEILDMFDGFLVPGGEDVDPVFYNEPLHYKTVRVKKEVDETDLMVIKYATEKKKPLLGICRGLQVINVFFNGTLNQHILNHSKPEGLINHDIKVIDGRIFKCDKKIINVNSSHHQSVKDLGENLTVMGLSTDGVVEIIEHETLPILAVQFHPEIMDNKELPDKLLECFKFLFM